MPQPKTFRDSNGKVWDMKQFDDTRYRTFPKQPKKKKIKNLLGKV